MAVYEVVLGAVSHHSNRFYIVSVRLFIEANWKVA